MRADEERKAKELFERQAKTFKERKIRQFLKEMHYKKFIDSQSKKAQETREESEELKRKALEAYN